MIILNIFTVSKYVINGKDEAACSSLGPNAS